MVPHDSLVSLFVTSRNLLFGVFMPGKIVTSFLPIYLSTYLQNPVSVLYSTHILHLYSYL